MNLLVAREISVHRAGHTLLSAASLELAAGELHVLLGPNGAGKSTLLKALSGQWPTQSGSITLSGTPLASLTALQQARQRAVLPQHDALAFGFSVLELVTLGRHAAIRQSASQEQQLIDAVLAATDIAHLRDRHYPTLSGGEQRRAQLARVLAQIWDLPQPVLLLDEPTHSLDLAHQHSMMSLLHTLTVRGFAVLASLHDINLAAAYAHRISLLKAGQLIATGTPATVLDQKALQNLYGEALDFIAVEHNGSRQWLLAHAPSR